MLHSHAQLHVCALPIPTCLHGASVQFPCLTRRYIKHLGEQTEQLLADFPTSYRPPGTKLLPVQFISGNDLTVRRPLQFTQPLTLYHVVRHTPILHHSGALPWPARTVTTAVHVVPYMKSMLPYNPTPTHAEPPVRRPRDGRHAH